MWKKIAMITSISIVSLIIVLIGVFAIIPVNLTPNISYNAQYGVQIYQLSDNEYKLGSNEYNDIISNLNKGFKTSFLNGFTAGLSKNSRYTVERYVQGKELNTLKNESKYTLQFRFSEKQPIYKADGKVFTSFADDPQFYNSYMIVLTEDSSGFDSVDIWFCSDTISDRSNIRLSGFGKFKSLIKYLDKLKENL